MSLMSQNTGSGYQAPALAAYSNFPTQSLMMWVYMDTGSWANPVTGVNNSTIWAHGVSALQTRYPILEMSASGLVKCTWDFSTTAATAQTSQALPTKKWVMIAFTFAGTGNAPKVYIGDLTSPVTESAYLSTTVAAGTPKTASILPVIYGYREDGQLVQQPLKLWLGPMMWVGRNLTVNQIRSWQFQPYYMSGTLAYHNFGDAGTALSVDYSGYKNNAFPTSSASVGIFTVKPNCPLPHIF